MNRARGFPLQECADRIRELRSARRRSVPQKTRPCGRMADPDYSPPPELCVYRRHTTYLLHRYFRMAIEVGRLPSLLGREFFRARVSHRRRLTFEDAVIFVHDVEGCLERLDTVSRTLIACIVFQDYSREETSQLLHCNYRTVKRRFPEALDRVTEMFQETGILQMLPRPRRAVTFEAKVEAADGEAAEETPPTGAVQSICAQAEVLVLETPGHSRNTPTSASQMWGTNQKPFASPKLFSSTFGACQAPRRDDFSASF